MKKFGRFLALSAAAVLTLSTLGGCGTDSSEHSAVLDFDNSRALVEDMKIGWNMGNTLDAPDGETSWGQPEITPELIKSVKELGFKTIRLPVSWGKHTVDEDYTIDSAFLDRVQEVVDYCFDNDLYVIVNSHHDNDFYYPSKERFEEGSKFIESIWSQVAERFKDYGTKLIFESMNEPRLAGTGNEWWFDNNSQACIESMECIVDYNQIFVDAVRGEGGLNKDRYLMVPSYAASADTALNSRFTLPEDTIENHLIVSVHSYSPYNFALNGDMQYTTFDPENQSDVASIEPFMKSLAEKYTEKGIGVVIGECGATNKNNLEDRVAWAEYFTSTAKSCGITCCLWDNGGTGEGGEQFGLINRYSKDAYFPEILDALMAGIEDK